MQGTQINPSQWRSSQAPTSPQLPLRPSSKGAKSRIRVMRSLRLHKLPALLVTLTVLGVGLPFLMHHKLSYSAASLVYVSPTFPKTLNEDRETEHPYDSYMQQQVHSVTRYDVIADAITSLPKGVWRTAGEPEAVAVERLQHSLSIKRVESTYEFSISLISQNPGHLADIVNAVTRSYLAKTKQEEFYGRDERLVTLRDTRKALQKELDAKLQQQNEITQKLGVAVIGSGDGSNPYDDQLAKIRTDLATAHGQRIEAEAQLNALQNGDPSSPNAALNEEADAVIEKDPQLMAVKSMLGQKRSAVMEQLAGLTANNPLRKQSEADLIEIDTGLRKMEDDLRRKASAQLELRLHSRVRKAAMVEAQMQSELQRDSMAANTAAPNFQLAIALKADIDRLQARYTEVDNRIGNLELESSSPGTVRLYSAAMPPLSPEPSKVKLALPLLIPIAFLMGIGTALLIDLLDPGVYTGEDLEGVLGFSPIGSLFSDSEVTQLVFDECVLRLAAAVDHATRLAGVRTFVLTAVGAEGGTTSLVENLAHSLAGLGRKVITIDASGNTNPIAYAAVEANDGNVARRRPLNTATQQQGIQSGLQAPMVSAQSLPSQAASLPSFVSEAFQKLTNDYDIVLIDTAPLLFSAETEYLARCADVTILVATAGKTTRAKLARAARVLEKIDVPGVAAVINDVSLVRADDSVRSDVLEFEARADAMNLRWKPKFSPFEVGVSGVDDTPERTPSSEGAVA